MEVPVVLDTNVFVAAGFNPRSESARILAAVRDGRLRMAWSQATRRETERIVGQIPPIRSMSLDEFFREADRLDVPADALAYAEVPDAEDRKFAALADAAGAVLVTADDHLLVGRDAAPYRVLTPGEFARECAGALE